MSTTRITMQDNNSNDLFQKNVFSEKVIDILMEWIMEGKLRMGDRLNANQIAQSLGISRMPVREALLDLEKCARCGLYRFVPLSKIFHK